jgi:hypothetical protein
MSGQGENTVNAINAWSILVIVITAIILGVIVAAPA